MIVYRYTYTLEILKGKEWEKKVYKSFPSLQIDKLQEQGILWKLTIQPKDKKCP